MIHPSHRIGSIGLALTILVALGCTTTKVVQQYDGGPLPRPDAILVHEFAYSPSQVKLTRGIAPAIEDAVKGGPRTQQQLDVGSKVASVVAEHLVKELRDMGLPAELAFGAAPVVGTVYALEGQFLSIDEGNRTERVVIGLGMGRTDVKTMVQFYHDADGGQLLTEELDVSAKSSRKPGMAIMMAAGGAALGNLAVSAAVSGATALGSEKFGANVEADASRTAKAVAKELRPFFEKQGWIAN